MLEINSEFQSKITMKGNGKVTSKSVIEIVGTKTQMEIEHTADFSKIPTEHHQIFFDSFTESFKDINVYDNVDDSQEIREHILNYSNKESWRFDKIVDIFLNRREQT